jgi:antitoxin component of MazEF toxin-antitoxin module
MDRKTSQKNVRKLVRLGKTSLAVTIPKEILLELGWRDNQKVVVKTHGNGLLIEDWPGTD